MNLRDLTDADVTRLTEAVTERLLNTLGKGQLAGVGPVCAPYLRKRRIHLEHEIAYAIRLEMEIVTDSICAATDQPRTTCPCETCKPLQLKEG
jgi:hypothetical protein